MAKKRVSPRRCRTWSFICYDEGEDTLKRLLAWKFFVETQGIDFAVSPLHSPDEGEDEGGEVVAKKPHWHVVCRFSSPVTETYFNSLLDSLCPVSDVQCVDSSGSVVTVKARRGVTRAFSITNFSGIVRYLIHLDNVDKQQFSDLEIDFCIKNSSVDVQNEWDKGELPDWDLLYTEIEKDIFSGRFHSLHELIIGCGDNADKVKAIRKKFSYFHLLISDELTSRMSNFEKSLRVSASKKFSVFDE